MKKNNKKGFTLAEMLIVVAIIGVLVAIMVPTFTTQLEKAKEATDAANIRGAISELQSAWLSNSVAAEKTVTISQGTAGWAASGIADIGGHAVTEAGLKDAVKGGTFKVKIAADGTISFAFTAAN